MIYCIYCEGLPIKRRLELEILQEMIVSELAISRKKLYVINLYRSPGQNNEQFEIFISNLCRVKSNIRSKRPSRIVFTGDFNCRYSYWWTEDIENPKGETLEEFMETCTLYQLMKEPTNIRNASLSCLELTCL